MLHPDSSNVIILHNYSTFVKTKKLLSTVLLTKLQTFQISPVLLLMSFWCFKIQARLPYYVWILFMFMILVPRTGTDRCSVSLRGGQTEESKVDSQILGGGGGELNGCPP